MDRRAFIHHLALLAAGAAALPSQVEAFEALFTHNTPVPVGQSLIAVHGITVCGIAQESLPAVFEFSRRVSPTLDLPLVHFAVNLYGGMYRWMAPPALPFLFTSLEQLRFRATSRGGASHVRGAFVGNVDYIAQDGTMHCLKLTSDDASLAHMRESDVQS